MTNGEFSEEEEAQVKEIQGKRGMTEKGICVGWKNKEMKKKGKEVLLGKRER